jgi:hypothetical protein
VIFGASTRRSWENHRVVELLLALRDSSTVSLRVPSGHHVEVGARRPPGTATIIRGTLPPFCVALLQNYSILCGTPTVLHGIPINNHRSSWNSHHAQHEAHPTSGEDICVREFNSAAFTNTAQHVGFEVKVGSN